MLSLHCHIHQRLRHRYRYWLNLLYQLLCLPHQDRRHQIRQLLVYNRRRLRFDQFRLRHRLHELQTLQ